MKNVLRGVFTVLFFSYVNLSIAQTASSDNKIYQTITLRPIPKGPSVFGIFEGRVPCPEIARQLNISLDANCEKLKCRISFYQNSETFQPTTFVLDISGGGDVVKQERNSYRRKIIEGKWSIIKGLKSNPDAEVYQMQPDKSDSYLYILKGDENVLFVLDENKEFRVGNENFSFTFNRVELVPNNK